MWPDGHQGRIGSLREAISVLPEIEPHLPWLNVLCGLTFPIWSDQNALCKVGHFAALDKWNDDLTIAPPVLVKGLEGRSTNQPCLGERLTPLGRVRYFNGVSPYLNW